MSFNHETEAVCLSQKTVRKPRDAPPLERLTAAELECLTPRMVYAAGVRGALFEHYFFLKAVCRRLSKHNGGLFQLNDGAGLPAHEDRQGKRWLWPLLGSTPFAPRRHRPTSATLVADASMCGWGAPLFKDSGEVCVAGGVWGREPHCIS
ncbi:hypothetical protein TRVL_04136 [Trypanosoma vivax]|nr:hypothetical protein TRVL_04136 [Trypanosoma vivax]